MRAHRRGKPGTCRCGAALFFFVMAGLPFGPPGALAGIYKWVDDQGRVQFSDRPPVEVPAEEVALPRINTYQGITVEEDAEMRSGSGHAGRPKKVVMYSAAWCGVCKRAREFFQARGIPFREMDVEQNTLARRELERMNARGVPVILVGGKRMNGFSSERFMTLYRE